MELKFYPMAPIPPASFEDMANVYDSLSGDLRTLSHLEGLSLDAILRRFGAHRVLDCACGTGVQTLALAQQGYEVFASDISPTMVSVLRKKASRLGLRVVSRVADFTNLSPWKDERFDAVICAGNSFGVLHGHRQFVQAVTAMKGRLQRPNGVVILGLRNYKRLRRQGLDLVSRPPQDADVRWYDIRVFRNTSVDIAYLRLVRGKEGLNARTWLKSYSYLDPREAIELLHETGFPCAKAYDVKGLGPYRGGEWGFACGSWARPTKPTRPPQVLQLHRST